MRKLTFALLLSGILTSPLIAEKLVRTGAELPTGKGLPLSVRTGLAFIALPEVNENEGTFTATVDLRLMWQDLRLKYPRETTPAGYMEFEDEEADAKLAEIWAPRVAFGNIVGEPSFQRRGIRIFPDGKVEVLQRTTAKFEVDYVLDQFPFDRQKLVVELVTRNEPVERILLDYVQEDLEFSRPGEGVELAGWKIGLVEMMRDPVQAWYGERNPRLKVGLIVQRDQPTLIATIFVPLFASLLIPMLVLWLNHTEDGEFKVEAFELTNINIGGLFAVVALNFTIFSGYAPLANGNNPVMSLFGLNYFALALSFAIAILLFRFNLVKKLFGRHVQEEVFQYLLWATPVLIFGAAISIVLRAAV